MNVTPHHLESLGWTLIHFCWQAAAIAIAYKLAELLVSRDPQKAASHIRYVLALIALLGMLAAAAGTFGYEEMRLKRVATAEASFGRFETGSTTNESSTANATTSPSHLGLTPAIHSMLPRGEAVLPWLDALWMLGVFALSARTIGGWLLLQRLRSTATRQIPPELAASFERLARRIGVQGRVALRLSTRIASPLAVGMVRSLILLPASALTTLNVDQLEAVLAHELAHIRRADYLWNILQTMIETLFFFHPAVWWIGTQLRQQRELCCDDIAIASCADPLTYATALLALEEQRAQLAAQHTANAGLPLALALDGHQSPFTLRSRIARILGEPMQPTTAPRTLAPLSILGVCAALALFALPVPQVLASLRPQTPQTPQVPALVAPEQPAAVVAEPLPAQTPATQTPTTAPLNRPAEPLAVETTQPTAKTPLVAPEPKAVAAPVATPRPAVAPLPVATPAPAPAPKPQVSALGVEIIRAITMAARSHNDDAKTRTLTMKSSNSYRSSTSTDDGSFQIAMTQTATSNTASITATATTAPKSDYITAMRAAGYNEDLDQYIAMKIQGITPEYASQMAQVGYGKPTAKDLLALKIHGVTPEYLNQLKAAGLKPESIQDAVSYRIFNVTPEYVDGMKTAGFADLPAKKLVELRVQNITPDFARTAKQQFPDININQLVQLRIFRIDDAFIAKAKTLGLAPLTVDKLVRLRTSGLLDDQRVTN